MDIERYLTTAIRTDALKKGKIAFISGPRQCGKTTLAHQILKKEGNASGYFSWDDDDFRKKWIRSPKSILEEISLGNQNKNTIIFDELHKNRRWKTSLKGLFDLYHKQFNFVITGSARLDFYRKGGDSLQGRYFPYRLHGFSLGEKNKVKAPPREDWLENSSHSFHLKDLLTLGGFPEPLLSGSETEAVRWRRLHKERMIRGDLMDLKVLRDLQSVETLTLLLEENASSQLSYNSLREDLNVSFATVYNWISMLEALYFCFLIRPYTQKIKRSIKKEPKIYLWDWSRIKNDGAKLENLVASHLLKACHAWTDTALGEYNLYYLRDKEKREIDFVITESQKPFALIEVKSSNKSISQSLIHFTKILSPKFSIQLVSNKKDEGRYLRDQSEILKLEVSRFLSALT